MDNLDDSENNAKVSDSAYSNSCSNSQSRRSHSSKSTHSGSNSSGSSGYGGKQSTSGISKTLVQLPEKKTKDKDGKKKKQAQTELEQNQTDVEFRLPDPAPITESVDVLQNASPPPASDQTQNGVQRTLEVATKDVADESVECCSISQTSMQLVPRRGCSEEGFSCVISMHDGVVLYMSTTLTSVLGFPKDMWIGRSFIDFVHPLDHNTFASQITHGLAVPKKQNVQTTGVTNVTMSTIFCRIRKYRSLSTGFNVKDRPISYMPFMLKQCLKQVSEDKESAVYLVIQATPVSSLYKTRNEPVENAIAFVMRHVANGNVEYIDNEAVPLLGYLPQEVTNKNILKLYHPEDLSYLRRIYETVAQTGRFARSKPYRLMAQNGDYLKLETEWSSFINPWSRKLEFVIGKHYIVEGPTNPDVFDPPPVPKSPKSLKLAHEDAFEIEGLRESIVRILNEVPLRPGDQMKHQMSKRCHDLASFMENLIQDQPKPEDELRIEIQDNDNSYYERDSVMLGGISPHHDYSDSKSSSGVPLSYNQLNYNVNLKRYFDSHQEAFDEDGVNCTDTTLVLFKENVYARQCMSPMAQHSCDSVEMTSVESACLTYVDNTELPNEYQPTRLTASILIKHNSEMEKIFVKKHHDTRSTKKDDREKYNNETKQKKRDHLVRCNASFVPTSANSVSAEPQSQGLKRSGKHTEAYNKHHCPPSRQMRRRHPSVSPTRERTVSPTPQPSVSSTAQPSVSTATPIWPQSFANGMAPFIPQQMPLVTPVTAVQGFVPLFYVPTAAASVAGTSKTSGHDTTRNFAQFQSPTVQYMTYGQAVFGTPIMVSPVSQQPTFPKPPTVIQSPCTSAQNNIRLTARSYEEALIPGIKEKPLGKAELAALREEKRAAAAGALSPPMSTRVAETFGIKTSICSATNALNRSNEEIPDPMMAQDSKMKSEGTVDRTDESSYSSFYSSFFKTESGSAEDSGDSKNKHTTGSTFSGKLNLRGIQQQRKKKEPPWMEQVSVTSELIYKYQVLTKSLDEVLISDKKKLEKVEQPPLVNEQLSQLYADLQLEGVAARLTLEEGITSSGSSSEDGHKFAIDTLAKRMKKKRKYSKLVMIYEEEAPLPSPESNSEPEPSTSLA